MEHTDQGVTLWYGTPDAPAPLEGTVQPRRGNVVVMGVQPADPSNVVTVKFRVDDGPTRAVRAVRFKSDFASRTEYFRALLPDFWDGSVVSYLPVATTAKRRVPSAADNGPGHSSTFRLEDLSSKESPRFEIKSKSPVQFDGDSRIQFSFEYIMSVHVPLKEPETIGVTPEGIMVNWYWYPSEGVVKGPKLNGKVRQLGGDWMKIRRDGIGIMDVRATVETTDGALIFIEYLGHFDLGENGYADFLDHRWPQQAPTRTAPRFHTAHPDYIWLNRVQAFGVGEVCLGDLAYVSDVYAIP